MLQVDELFFYWILHIENISFEKNAEYKYLINTVDKINVLTDLILVNNNNETYNFFGIKYTYLINIIDKVICTNPILLNNDNEICIS